MKPLFTSKGGPVTGDVPRCVAACMSRGEERIEEDEVYQRRDITVSSFLCVFSLSIFFCFGSSMYISSVKDERQKPKLFCIKCFNPVIPSVIVYDIVDDLIFWGLKIVTVFFVPSIIKEIPK